LRKFPERFNENLIIPAFVVVFYHFTASVSIEIANILFLTRHRTLVELMMSYVTFLGVSHLDELYVEATHKMKSAKQILEARGEERRIIDEAVSWNKYTDVDAAKAEASHQGDHA